MMGVRAIPSQGCLSVEEGGKKRPCQRDAARGSVERGPATTSWKRRRREPAPPCGHLGFCPARRAAPLTSRGTDRSECAWGFGHGARGHVTAAVRTRARDAPGIPKLGRAKTEGDRRRTWPCPQAPWSGVAVSDHHCRGGEGPCPRPPCGQCTGHGVHGPPPPAPELAGWSPAPRVSSELGFVTWA